MVILIDDFKYFYKINFLYLNKSKSIILTELELKLKSRGPMDQLENNLANPTTCCVVSGFHPSSKCIIV